MHVTKREFHFAYGHRVWSIEGENRNPDRRLHGHNAKVVIHFESDELNENGNIFNSSDISWIDEFFENQISNRFLLHLEDPLKERLLGENPVWKTIYVPETAYSVGYVLTDVMGDIDDEGLDGDYNTSFFLLDFMPTPENLSKWVFEFVEKRMDKLGISVNQVSWYETPTVYSTYVPRSQESFAIEHIVDHLKQNQNQSEE